MVSVPLELKLSEEKFDLLIEVARFRDVEIGVILETAILEWLSREIRLQRARQRLQRFAQGIGQSQPPHDGARQHDRYLYQHQQT